MFNTFMFMHQQWIPGPPPFLVRPGTRLGQYVTMDTSVPLATGLHMIM